MRGEVPHGPSYRGMGDPGPVELFPPTREYFEPEVIHERRRTMYRDLGNIEDDLIRIFSLIGQGAYAQAKLAEFESLIKAKAKEGALEAIPDIKAQIQPFVIASLLIGLAGFLFGLSAWLSSRRA